MNPQDHLSVTTGMPQPGFVSGQPTPGFSAPTSPYTMASAPQAPTYIDATNQGQGQAGNGTSNFQGDQFSATAVAPIDSTHKPPAQSPEETGELLDEGWVEKAKEIVAKTHADPYLQANEISKLKTQYIKARYNKDIKASEE